MSDALFEQDHAQEREQLASRFGVPPFSTLNARGSDWQALKRKWKRLGIRSEEGRDLELIPTGDSAVYGGKDSLYSRRRGQNTLAQEAWKNVPFQGPEREEGQQNMSTSIFDPVLAEIAYEWFCPREGWILDPFAGGSVRGLVASKLGRRYIGLDLRQEQVDANWAQVDSVLAPADPRPAWICANSLRVVEALSAEADRIELPATGGFDFVFSCPPYHDLEQYSSDPEDLSNLSWAEFCQQYEEIILRACALLRADRFAAFVVGEVRDRKTGIYRGLVPETVRAFEAAGLGFYNDIIVETSIASAPLRSRMFSASRKVVKVHQNLLVFVKGSWQAAAERMGRDVGLLLGAEPEAEQLELLPSDAEGIL